MIGNIYHMTLDQLHAFVTVAETLNMTRAAERLHLTQPSVSAAIATLENRHATRLFDRVGRRLELSEAGQLFLPEARAVLARAAAAGRVLDDLSTLARGSIRLAASQTVATYWLPRRMARFAEQWPAIALSLQVGNSAQSASAVLQGDADIGFVEAEVLDQALACETVASDHIHLYVAAGHPLAGSVPTLADLQSASWVMREPGSGTRDHAMAGLARSGLDTAALHIALELPSNGAALEAAEAGHLITAVSDRAAIDRVTNGTITRLDWAMPERSFTMLTHKERQISRAAAIFIAAL